MDSCPYCAAPITSSDQTCPNCGANLKGFQLEVGTTLGKYQIGKVLGQGGFGITYQARDTVLQREVAIKELFPDGSTRKNLGLIPPNSLGVPGFLEAKTRFLTEARTLAQFNHPGIVRVLEVFEANNTAYLVMEALTGETLGARITREKKLPEEVVKKLALELCDALEIVHGAGLLHRDIKPDNIFLTTDARVVLIDFGSARSFRASERTHHTQLVTPGYAAPEQYASEAKFGEYTDIYGLAATLYHALTGNPPQNATDRLLDSSQVKISENVSPVFALALEQALSLKIQDRPKSVQAFANTLENTSLDSEQNGKYSYDSNKSDPSLKNPVFYKSSDILVKDRTLIAHGITYFLERNSEIQVFQEELIVSYTSKTIGILVFISSILSFFGITFAIYSILHGILYAILLFPIAGVFLFFTYQEQERTSKIQPRKEKVFPIRIIGSGSVYTTDRTFHISKDKAKADEIADTVSQALKSTAIAAKSP